MKNKILIIEDNFDVRENIHELLVLSGYDTVTAANGKLGVQAALKEIPDLILCDIMMPELDGYGVLRILSKNPLSASIPFIFLTAKTEMIDMRRGMTLGADDYITKPFDDVELLDTIEIRLNKKKSAPQVDTTSLLSFLTGEQVLDLLPESFRESESRFIHKKDLLYAEGQNSRNVFIIKSGRAIATKVDDYSKEVILRLYQYPAIVGLSSVLMGQRYQETVKAFEDLEVIAVNKDEFIQFILHDKSLAFHFLHNIAADLVKADEKLLLQAYSSVRVKLAAVLLDLYPSYESEGRAVIPITREDLASMAGTAKETIIRCLSEFKEEGLVNVDGSDIIIENIRSLIDLRY
ncbi:MAG TPA: response regulator [Saprospiraceae bacterium]|nr:response regulator [Saprospiraceae bacterium]